MVDTDCSYMSGDLNPDFSLHNTDYSRDQLEKSKKLLGNRDPQRLEHENYPGLGKSSGKGNQDLHRLNDNVNNRYDKLGLKDYVSKPKLWDIFGKMAHQVARKGDPNNLINQRRLTADFHRPSEAKGDKEDPQKYLKILVEYL